MAAARRVRPFSESKEYVRIVGNSVEYVHESVNRVVKLEDLVQGLASQGGMITPTLPNGCRLFIQKNNQSIYVVEKPPQVRQLHWTRMHADEEKIKWKLAFPYTIFVITFNNTNIMYGHLFYMTTPIKTITDTLLYTNLCNVDSTGKICTGGMRATGTTNSDKAESFIAAFWQSEFNADLISHGFTLDARKPRVASVEAWQTSSKADPLFPLEEKWREAFPIQTLITSLQRGVVV